MTRRDFLQRLGLGAAAVALGPLLDLPITPAPSAACTQDDYVAYIRFSARMWISNPAMHCVITGIDA